MTSKASSALQPLACLDLHAVDASEPVSGAEAVATHLKQNLITIGGITRLQIRPKPSAKECGIFQVRAHSANVILVPILLENGLDNNQDLGILAHTSYTL